MDVMDTDSGRRPAVYLKNKGSRRQPSNQALLRWVPTGERSGGHLLPLDSDHWGSVGPSEKTSRMPDLPN
jgi:hypothetical protein